MKSLEKTEERMVIKVVRKDNAIKLGYLLKEQKNLSL